MATVGGCKSPSEEIRELALLFRKETTCPLTNYQKKMNEAAQQLCLANPALIKKRSFLMDEARAKIIKDGFQFVKGKSRSTRGEEPVVAKRQYHNQGMREQRLRSIEEDCQDLADRILFKEKRITTFANVMDYKKCDELKEEVMALKQERRQLEEEARALRKSNSITVVL